jgi:hypothetical protein
MISKVYNENDNRPKSLEDEFSQIGVDFDGVIHGCSKGYHDGTIYDSPIEGTYKALSELSGKYTIIVYSAKARSDRPLVNGKTGVELIWEWLERYDMKKFVNDVTAEKPRAIFYIDDRAIRFTNWNSCMETIEGIQR